MSDRRIVIASENRDKIAEIRRILDLPGVEWCTRDDFSAWPDVDENGTTFEENALIKAHALVEALGVAAVADDSGLEVDALGGAPGVFSARYAGPGCSYADNNAKLLRELDEMERAGGADAPPVARAVRFVCVAVYVDTDGLELVARGVCSGEIARKARGERGFGYDPVFVPEGLNLTMAQLPPAEKDSLSHRGKAFRALKNEMAAHLIG